MSVPLISLWHGGHRFDSTPEIRPAKRGRFECGPGIYATTHYQRARNYAKGGGATHLIEFAPRLMLEDAALSLATATAIAGDVLPKRLAQQVKRDLIDGADRLKDRIGRLQAIGEGSLFVPASNLLNLCVNCDGIVGVRGPLLAQHLAGLGIDASFHHVSGNEWWAVIFNPRCIRRVTKVAAKDIGLDRYELPAPKAQRERAAAPEDCTP